MPKMFDERLPPRFWEKVVPAPGGDCWIWTASLDQDGYGNWQWEGKPYRAHRAAYLFLVGEIPEGLVLDHICKERWCVNPGHLEPVTIGENSRRGDGCIAFGEVAKRRAAMRTHCKHGHEFTPENTRIYSARSGRVCLACEKERPHRRKGLTKNAVVL